MEKKGLLIFLTGLLCAYVFSNTPPYLVSPQNEAPINTNTTFRWVSNDALRNHELKIYDCNYDAGNANNSLNLGDYELINTNENIGRNLNVSGLAFAIEKSNLLVSCNNGLKQLNNYPLGVSGFGTYNFLTASFPNTAAYGGITHLSNGNYVLIENTDRNSSTIYYIQYEARPALFIGYENTPRHQVNAGSIEGISFNPTNNKIYLAKEKSPMAIYEINAFKAPDFQGSISLSEPFDMDRAARKWGIKSINGLFYLGQDKNLSGTKASEHLLVLSAESNVVIETDMRGNEISRLKLNAGGANNTITSALADANGIAYFNGAIYIATQSEQSSGRKAKLYLFRNRSHENPSADLGSNVFSKKRITGNSYNSVPVSTLKDNKTYCWKIIGTTNDGQTTESNIFSFKTGTPLIDCTDPKACNYNPDATQNGNNCEYKSCEPKISEISSPSSGQQFYPGDVINIKWVDNFPENVTIKIESPNVNRTINSSTASDGSYSYTLPNDLRPASNYRILIYKRDEPKVERYSFNFTILDELEIDVYGPTAGSRYQIGGKVNVKWEHNLTGSFDVSFYKGNSYQASVVKNRTTPNFDYTIPSNLEEGDDYRFKVKSNTTNIVVYSPYFTLYKTTRPETLSYYVDVTAPTANAIYKMDENVTIRWEDNFSEPVDIFLFKNDKYVQDIAKNISGNSYNYKFNDLKQSNDYQIYIRSTQKLTTADFSSNFTLLESKIKVTSPVANNSYQSGSYISVRWKDVSSNNVSIKLYQNNTFVMTIAERVPNTGVYDFKTPDINGGSDFNIVVTSLDDPSKKGKSELFNIVLNQGISNIELSNGSLGTNKEFLNDDELTVTWRDRVKGKVTIQLFRNNELVRSLVVRTFSDGNEKIKLPGENLVGSNYRIKVYSVRNHSTLDFSDPFSLVDKNGNKTEQNNNQFNPLKVYPNPTKGTVLIDMPNGINNKQIQLRVFDLFGRTTMENTYTNFNEQQIGLDFSDFVKGIYFIHLKDSDKEFQSKIVVD